MCQYPGETNLLLAAISPFFPFLTSWPSSSNIRISIPCVGNPTDETWRSLTDRLLPDGTLIHLGRLDTMVKIRGNRVELTEIERALSTHEDVRDCAVAIKDDRSGNQRLIAYVVAGKLAPSVVDLRQFVSIQW